MGQGKQHSALSTLFFLRLRLTHSVTYPLTHSHVTIFPLFPGPGTAVVRSFVSLRPFRSFVRPSSSVRSLLCGSLQANLLFASPSFLSLLPSASFLLSFLFFLYPSSPFRHSPFSDIPSKQTWTIHSKTSPKSLLSLSLLSPTHFKATPMSFPSLVSGGGAECGPVNPMNGLVKSFSRDRTLQQVRCDCLQLPAPSFLYFDPDFTFTPCSPHLGPLHIQSERWIELLGLPNSSSGPTSSRRPGTLPNSRPNLCRRPCSSALHAMFQSVKEKLTPPLFSLSSSTTSLHPL